MSLNFKVQAGGESKFDVPPGMYRARLDDVKEMPPSAKNPDWGPSLVWEFEVLEGEHTGKRPSCFTPCTPSTANGLGRLLQTMLGRKIQPGEDIDAEALIGKEYQITVSPNKDGTKNRVNAAFPAHGISAQSTTAAGKAPPPPVKKAAAKTPPPASKWMVHDPESGEYKPMTAEEAEKFFVENEIQAEDGWVYPDDGKEHEPKAVKEAKEYGFKGFLPF